MTKPFPSVAEYLWQRLVQLGCTSLHGVPGDFNLVALDSLEACHMRWVGNCNELNAGYAADGYARVKGLGALATTFGVGELSAINAIAGSYAEMIPVVHIVGSPSRASQRKQLLMHHTLGNGDYQVFARMYKDITVAQADLTDPLTAASEIDRVLRECVLQCRPVYLAMPADVAVLRVGESLIDQPLNVAPPSSNMAAETQALAMILQRISGAIQPVLLLDGAIIKRKMTKQVECLVRKLGIPCFVTPMGKGAVNERLRSFIGTYAGDNSDHGLQERVESSDLIIMIGRIASDVNTGGFTCNFKQEHTISIQYDRCEVGFATFEEVYWHSIIPRLTELIVGPHFSLNAKDSSRYTNGHCKSHPFGPDAITHEWFWHRVGEWLQDEDMIVCDTGTSFIGCREMLLPRNAMIMSQILWSSVGYGVGAAQGAALAVQDLGSCQRTILFEGDGSFQMTAQELSTMIRYDLNVTIFLIANEGYTIERFVHGPEATYNDIFEWQWAELPHLLQPPSSQRRLKTWDIRSKDELDRLLDDEEFAHGKGLQFCVLRMPKMDAPQKLIDFAVSAAKRNQVSAEVLIPNGLS